MTCVPSSDRAMSAAVDTIVAAGRHRKLTWNEFYTLLRTESLPPDIGPRPSLFLEGILPALFQECPKRKRPKASKNNDRWQNSGGKKGSTFSPDGVMRCRHGSLTNEEYGTNLKYLEVSLNVDTLEPRFSAPLGIQRRKVFQVLPAEEFSSVSVGLIDTIDLQPWPTIAILQGNLEFKQQTGSDASALARLSPAPLTLNAPSDSKSLFYFGRIRVSRCAQQSCLQLIHTRPLSNDDPVFAW